MKLVLEYMYFVMKFCVKNVCDSVVSGDLLIKNISHFFFLKLSYKILTIERGNRDLYNDNDL